MPTRALMIQGTGSDVGKSLLVADTNDSSLRFRLLQLTRAFVEDDFTGFARGHHAVREPVQLLDHEPPARRRLQRDLQRLIHEITMEGVDMLRPGVPLREVAAHVNARVDAIDVPGDLSLIVFDDNPWTELVSPPLSVVRQPIDMLALHSVELAGGRLQIRTRPGHGVAVRLHLAV